MAAASKSKSATKAKPAGKGPRTAKPATKRASAAKPATQSVKRGSAKTSVKPAAKLAKAKRAAPAQAKSSKRAAPQQDGFNHASKLIASAVRAPRQAASRALETARSVIEDAKKTSMDDIKQLFADAMKGVIPAKPAARADVAAGKPTAVPRQRIADEKQAAAEMAAPSAVAEAEHDWGDLSLYLRPGLPRDVLRRLRRGDWSVQNAIDVSMVSMDDARKSMALFLAESRKKGFRCVKVTHGKRAEREHGEGGARMAIRSWLTQRDEILAFADARGAEGGDGAVMVLLKARSF